MRYLSLFSGVGGFDLALNRQGHECIGFSEIDSFAVQIYERHFPGIKNYGDITQIKEQALPDFDILCGGFPCQPWSIAGNRKGLKDSRGQLFNDVVRIAASKKPRLLFLENVRALLNHDKGNSFRQILNTLCELGYCCEWQVLDSASFNVPQHRERLFIIGHFGEEPARLVFPMQPTTAGSIKAIQVENPGYVYKRRNCVYDVQGLAPTLTVEDTGHTLLSIGRRLTPLEAERLQGFPDEWTEGLSAHRRSALMGNAVTVPVVQEIAKRLG